jgi:hypothetical protein
MLLLVAIAALPAQAQLFERLRAAGHSIVGELGAVRCFTVMEPAPHPEGGDWALCVSLVSRPASDPAVILRWPPGAAARGRALTAGTLVTAFPSQIDPRDGAQPDVVHVMRDRRRWVDRGGETVGTWGYLVIAPALADRPDLMGALRQYAPSLVTRMGVANDRATALLDGAPLEDKAALAEPRALLGAPAIVEEDVACQETLATVDVALARLLSYARGGAPAAQMTPIIGDARLRIEAYYDHRALR